MDIRRGHETEEEDDLLVLEFLPLDREIRQCLRCLCVGLKGRRFEDSSVLETPCRKE